ncbi:MAG TPA: hypothetical protein PLE19_23045 [Planctomycetota bacterium]|nr:hypothetical protein [Planctomycetota bacterium]HRR82975.1 hypothetical protein [Planctomycetota bacterium]HRT96790.1 hypothetical protein [Planctomycetota bacterium]
MRQVVLLLAAALAAQAVAAEDGGMKHFPIDWRATERSVVDLSGLLEKSAGKAGQAREFRLDKPTVWYLIRAMEKP